MPSLDWNRQVWGRDWTWDRAGDEWNGMAAYCGAPYEQWKDALVETFLLPYAADRDVLEIAPGFGRWTEFLVDTAQTVTLVDINENCIDACRKRFGDRSTVSFHVGDGTSLPVGTGSVDFVWSFDSFVHMEPPVIAAYIREIGRVLRRGGTAVLHHADKRPWSLALIPATSRLGAPGRVVQRLASLGRLRDGGRRSDVTAGMVVGMATRAGLSVTGQTNSWGSRQQYTVDKFRDKITVLSKPA